MFKACAQFAICSLTLSILVLGSRIFDYVSSPFVVMGSQFRQYIPLRSLCISSRIPHFLHHMTCPRGLWSFYHIEIWMNALLINEYRGRRCNGYFCLIKNDFNSCICVWTTCSSEMIVLSRRARLYGILTLVCRGWQELNDRYCLPVCFFIKYVGFYFATIILYQNI